MAAPNSFSEHLDKVTAVYFTVTTLATVGYGDIVPVTHTAQVLATVQMLLDLVVIAVTARLLIQHRDDGAPSGAAETQRSPSTLTGDSTQSAT